MKKNLVILSLVAAMGLMLTSQSIAQSSQDRVPFMNTIDVCGELIDYEGEFHLVRNRVVSNNSVISNSENVMDITHINMKGTGVGQTSGAIYQANQTLNHTYSGSKGFSETYIHSFMLIGQGEAPNHKVNVSFHITKNANGELTALVDNFSAECK